jgi:hypothetical protein
VIPVQLSADEFKDIHNAKCLLHSVLQRVEGVIGQRIYDELLRAYNQLNDSLKGAYKQEAEADEVRETAIRAVDEQHDLKSIWSMDNYDFAAKIEPKPVRVLYKNHWGPAPISVEVKGDTWLDLWLAADAAIRYSGDDHHIFIEGLRHLGDGMYELSTGS